MTIDGYWTCTSETASRGWHRGNVETPEFQNTILFELEGQAGALMQALPDGVVVVDPNGLIVFVNSRLEDISDYRRDELIGQPIELLVPDRLIAIHEGHRHAFHDEPRLRSMGTGLDIQLRRRDGSEIPVGIQLSPIELGSRACSVAAVRDISASKEAEEALRRSEERFRMLVEAAPVMVFTLSPEGIVGSVNRACESITGWRVDQLLGKHFGPFIHPDDLSRTLATVGQASRGEQVELVEVRILTPNGGYLIAESTMVPVIANGIVVEILGVARDITERNHTEEALRQSEERFCQAFKQGALGIALVDLESRITNINESLCHLVGYTREELLGATFRSITHPDDVDAENELALQLSEGTLPSYRIEKRFLSMDGRVAYGTVTASMIRSQLGDPLYGLVTVEDITERKQLERELASRATSATTTLGSLTPRETEILGLWGETETASAMADHLSVSVRTVESHLASAYRKLGVRTRADAIAKIVLLTGAVAHLRPESQGDGVGDDT
jgi:PAS domain S-box-containing protein